MTNIEIFISGHTEYDAVVQLEAILDMIKIAQANGNIREAGLANSTDDVDFDFTVTQEYNNANSEEDNFDLFPCITEQLNDLEIR